MKYLCGKDRRYLRGEQGIVDRWSPGLNPDVPLVSVVCITYNHERFIEDALRGFLIQETDFPFEVIVHDDASTDHTPEIVRTWAEAYPRIIRPIFQETNQYSQGRRITPLVIPHARGRYIALCEGDDYWTDPRKLQVQFDFLEANPEYVICYHDIDVEGDIEAGNRGIAARKKRDWSGQDLREARSDIRTHTMFFRNVLESFPPEFDLAGGGDRFIVSLLGQYGAGKYLEDVGASVYRIHGGGAVSSLRQKRESSLFAFRTWYWMHTYYDRIGDRELADKFIVRAVKRVMSDVRLTRPSFNLALEFAFPQLFQMKRLIPLLRRRRSVRSVAPGRPVQR